MNVTAWPGLGSSLTVSRDEKGAKERLLTVSVRPGLLHLAEFYFSDVAFVEGCRECLFEANKHIYLLDITERRLGTLAKGRWFLQLTPPYEKRL